MKEEMKLIIPFLFAYIFRLFAVVFIISAVSIDGKKPFVKGIFLLASVFYWQLSELVTNIKELK